jgi:hypothetical protein
MLGVKKSNLFSAQRNILCSSVPVMGTYFCVKAWLITKGDVKPFWTFFKVVMQLLWLPFKPFPLRPL